MTTTLTTLDPSQKDALESIINDEQNPISIIYGPPGTGKSHLIVSMLFELALRGKKVLFVSQNAEALEVIIRKYRDENKAFHFDAANLSFLDFCLCLNMSEHKRLKYIRGQYGRLIEKIIPERALNEPAEDDERIAYPLTYNQLSSDANNLADPELLGVDELLRSSLQNIRSGQKLIAKILIKIPDRDARAILKSLDDYRDEHDLFAKFNHPSNQLKFFSRSSSSFSLSSAKMLAQNTIEAIDKLGISEGLVSLKETSISDYLSNLIIVHAFNEAIFLEKFLSDGLTLSELYDDIEDVFRQQTSLSNVVQLEGLEAIETELLTAENDRFIHDLKTEDELSTLLDNLQFIQATTDELISKRGVNPDSTFTEIVSAAFKDLNFSNMLEIFPSLQKFRYDDIARTVEYLKTRQSQSSLKKALFKKLPSFIPEARSDNLKVLEANAIFFSNLLAILEGTNYSVADLLKLSSMQTHCVRSPIRAANTQNREERNTLRNLILRILERKPGSLWSSTPHQILADSASQITAIEHLLRILSTNVSVQFQDIHHLIEIVNSGIRNNRISKEFNQIIAKYRQYLRGDNQQAVLGEIITLRDKYPHAEEAITSIGKIPLATNYHSQDIISLQNIIAEGEAAGIFNAEYYTIHQGDNLANWRDHSFMILSYNNVDEFDRFIKHHRFIDHLRALLGAQNAKVLDSYLSSPDITYNEFKESLTHDIVRAFYESMPYESRRRMPKDYFKEYRRHLYNLRRAYYIDGIKKLRSECCDAAKSLSYFKNWPAAGTTMEKIRLNMSTITAAFPVIVATPADIAKYIEPTKELFDYVIFDEASQLLPGQAIPAIYRSKRVVIVGDPHQMPPTPKIEEKKDNRYDADSEDERSILDMAINLQLDSTYHLKVHYRSESNQLFEPSRSAIYEEDGIKPIFEAKSNRMPLYLEDNLGENDFDNFPTIIRRIENYLAEDENATFCLLFTRKDDKGLNGFKKFLDQTNNTTVLRLYEKEQLLMSTVTDCQGIEGDHSIIYFPHYGAPGATWFFNEKAGAYKRLNVSITRQKKTLDILMANPKSAWLTVCQGFIDDNNTAPNRLRSAKLFNTLLTNAGQAIDEEYLERTLGPNAHAIDSPLTEQLYDMLVEHYQDQLGSKLKIWCEVGWNMVIPNHESLERDRRNVGFRIDIGIYSVVKKKFILGIEMDGATYHSGFAKEFSDLQRQEVLEKKGWNIYRIWSTNWFGNERKEFDQLIATIDAELNKN